MSWSINWDAKITLNSLVAIEHISMLFPCKNNKNNNRFYMTYCCFYLPPINIARSSKQIENDDVELNTLVTILLQYKY